ncbi:MAG TPA: Rieske 2Fe-2S domain-containing protein [Planctomycetaceae bacterium]|nr:Rieske 2Fe-2S domain-containing protein [Planctomycetaceae bacterium]
MSRKVRAASVSEIPPGCSKELILEGRVLALFNVAGEFFAIDGICAHAGGPVGKGELRGNIVTCPWHGWQYDVRSGENCLNAAICQKKFPVSVECQEIFIEFSDP